jgi:hypothetical protein
MTRSRFTFLFILVVVLIMPWLLCAGTLDDAPFHIVVPSSDWQIKETSAQPADKRVFIAASIVNTNTPNKRLASIAIKYVLKETSASTLDDLCAGFREGLAGNQTTQISETETTFLGYKAKVFIYLKTISNVTVYNEVTIFIANGYGWSLCSVGPLEKKDEIKKIISIYRNNPA